MTRKKILFVAHHLTVGGVQKSLISALKAIDYEKNDVTVYIRKSRLELLEFIDKRANIIVNDDKRHYYRFPKAIFYQFGMVFNRLFHREKECNQCEKKLADYIRDKMMTYERENYFRDIEYDIAISYVQGYTALFVANYVNARKKYMFYQGSTDELHEVHEKVIYNFDKIIVEHEDIKELISSWYDDIRNKTVVLENYVDEDFIRAQAEAKVNINNTRVTICSCGRFAQVKGFDLAVEAAKILRDRGKSFYWYFVGDGPERQRIENMLKEYKLNDEIILVGMKKNPYSYINQCDIFVQPSYEEALSIVLLEVQMLRVPTVTTKTVGGCAMIKDEVNGLTADIEKHALAREIEKMIDDDALRKKCVENMMKKDYSRERLRYQDEWEILLEG